MKDYVSESVYESMINLLDRPSIEDMWCTWSSIANRIIPSSFEMVDALDSSTCPEVEDENLEEFIRDRISYLSDRLDASRCYWLDFLIRRYLKKPMRD